MHIPLAEFLEHAKSDRAVSNNDDAGNGRRRSIGLCRMQKGFGSGTQRGSHEVVTRSPVVRRLTVSRAVPSSNAVSPFGPQGQSDTTSICNQCAAAESVSSVRLNSWNSTCCIPPSCGQPQVTCQLLAFLLLEFRTFLDQKSGRNGSRVRRKRAASTIEAALS